MDDVLRFTTLFRSDPLYGRLLADEPEAFTRYTLQRVGSSQRMILRWLARAISSAQGDGSVRPGEPQEIAVMLLLIAQSAVLSHGTVADLISEAGWERELRAALDGAAETVNGASSAAQTSRDGGSISHSRPMSAADVLVVGGGITGAGVALDAASRGLRVTLIEADDLAFDETSRFSSKLVHGGLRYLATGDIATARESAHERHLLMTTIAPHLIRPLGQLLPFSHGVTLRQRAAGAVGMALGDLLRMRAHTPPQRAARPGARVGAHRCSAGARSRSARSARGRAVLRRPARRQMHDSWRQWRGPQRAWAPA